MAKIIVFKCIFDLFQKIGPNMILIAICLKFLKQIQKTGLPLQMTGILEIQDATYSLVASVEGLGAFKNHL